MQTNQQMTYKEKSIRLKVKMRKRRPCQNRKQSSLKELFKIIRRKKMNIRKNLREKRKITNSGQETSNKNMNNKSSN